MEEKSNKQFKFKELYYEFPKTIQITHEKCGTMYVYESPFGNCQTFTISKAYNLCEFDKEEITKLFQIIYNKFYRPQVIIDLKEEYNEEVLKKIEHITKNKYCTPYISTNESHMNLNLIQLDIEKLK